MRSAQKGFILPATIALGLATAIILTTFTQNIVSSSQTLSMQTYQSLAKEAASSGLTYAIGCVDSAVNVWSALTPATNCVGNGPSSGASVYLASSPGNNWRSTFSVANPVADPTNPQYSKISSTGTVEVLAGGIVVAKVTATRNVTLKVALESSPVSSGDSMTELAVDTHSCSIANGKLYCWGANGSGQLGTGDTTVRSVPTRVTANDFDTKIVTHVAVGTNNTCAVADGQLYCWGDNTYGQLATCSTVPCTSGGSRSTPLAVGSPLAGRKITSLSLSQGTPAPKSACAIADGIPYCWGANTTQQLGQSTPTMAETASLSTPTPIYGYRATDTSTAQLFNKKAHSVSVGSHTGCATAVGALYCWGAESGTATSPVQTMKSPCWMSGGWNNYCSLTMPVEPWSALVVGRSTCTSLLWHIMCHGTSSGFGTAGASPTVRAYNVVVTHQDAGEDTTNPGTGGHCVVTRGSGYCDTSSTNDFVGIGSLSNPATAARAVTKIGYGDRYGCMIANGGLVCWGNASQGQLANGSTVSSQSEPARMSEGIIGTTGGTSIYPALAANGPLSVGGNHVCSEANGMTFCWGSNSDGQLGRNDGSMQQIQPTTVDYSAHGIPHVNPSTIKTAAGSTHSCSIITSFVFCWGANTYGQLGTGDTNSSNTPRNIGGGTWGTTFGGGGDRRATDISAGPRNTCAIVNSQLYCWGANEYGQIGDGTTTPQTSPRLVTAFSGMQVMAVSVGTNHTCAIVDGDGYCWGSNGRYATGKNSNTGITANPLDGKLTLGAANTTIGSVVGATFTAISAGNNYSCAVMNGTAGCWGKNDFGQTGTGLVGDVPVPTTIGSGAGSLQAQAIDTGDTHSCALLQGRIYCWGNNEDGRVGNNQTTGTQPLPSLINTGAAIGRATTNISVGDRTSCSISNAVILCWGAGTSGQIGDSGIVDVAEPTAITGYRRPGEFVKTFTPIY